MPSLKWKSVAELAGIMAILAGLYFVYDEIRQTATIARAELAVVTIDNLNEIQDEWRDPVFSELYLKGLHSPDELDEGERFQLNAFYNKVMLMYLFELNSYRRGIFEEYDNLPKATASAFFASGYGRVWWNVEKQRASPLIVEAVDDGLKSYEGEGYFLDFDTEVRRQLQND
jgi:hypothetical protein